jgi:cardiolipin synthase
LTWLRIVLIPVFVSIYYIPDEWMSPVVRNWVGMGVFALAAITDWFDGYLARRWGETSAFGAFLDPVADKLMVGAALILLVELGRAEAYLAIIIIGREIAISALREWMAQIGASRSVAVHMLGKVKTVVQMIAIPFLLYHGTLFGLIDTQLWGTVLIIVSAVLTIWSMVYYLQKALPEIRARVR